MSKRRWQCAINFSLVLALVLGGILGDFALAQSAEAAAPNGGVSHWQFNEASGTVTADSWDGNNGTLVGGASRTAAGKVGRGLNLSGEARVLVPDSPNLRITGPITVEAWVSFNGVWGAPSVGNTPIVAKWGSSSPGTTAAYALAIWSDGRPFFDISTTGSDVVYVPAASPIQANTFTHLAGVWTGTEVQLYVNGVLSNSVPSQGPIYPSPVPVMIGGYNPPDSWGYISNLDGVIDEVKIYSRGLSAQEMQQEYRAGTTGQISYWNLNEGAGTTAGDSWDGNTLTVHGATWTTGKSGKALNFNGTDAYAEAPNSPNLNLSQITVSAWIKPSSATNADLPAIVDKFYYAPWGGYAFHLAGTAATTDGVANNAQCLYFAVATANGVREEVTDATVPLNVFTHVTASYDGTDIRMFINGAEVPTRIPRGMAGTGPMLPTETALAIGRQYLAPATTYRHFQGIIDEVKIYDRALSGTEVLQQYQTGGGTPVPVPGISTYGLIILAGGLVATTFWMQRRRPKPTNNG